MALIANRKTLVAVRTLVEYLANDERRDYLEQRERGEGEGHIYESVAQIEGWLSGQPLVLHMGAGSDSSFGLPQADCEILTAQEAAERFQWLLDDEQLPAVQYNPETDKVLARYEPIDAMGHRFYGFAPMVAETPDCYTELTYETSDIPLGLWQVKINDVVVYQRQEEEDEETDDGELGSSEEELRVHAGRGQTVIDLIKAEMRSRRITQGELARLAGVSEPCLHRLLARKSSPKLATVERVLNCLGYELRARKAKKTNV